MFKVMTPNDRVPILGSPGKMWDLLQPAAIDNPAIGARDGSYLTMDSGEGLLLAGVILVAGFGSVFVDPSYGQKAIAGEATAVVKGYFYGAFAYVLALQRRSIISLISSQVVCNSARTMCYDELRRCCSTKYGVLAG
jgi:Na+/proline symporter